MREVVVYNCEKCPYSSTDRAAAEVHEKVTHGLPEKKIIEGVRLYLFENQTSVNRWAENEWEPDGELETRYRSPGWYVLVEQKTKYLSAILMPVEDALTALKEEATTLQAKISRLVRILNQL